ncbi:hypothetical protein ANMWB30_23970 [Arthrobacter sp. MWB30]|nr:hypothetical protein ANMWB30_23970 [Arthrobacter sp. MWB30]
MDYYHRKVRACNDMLKLARGGTTVWWRREEFHGEFSGIEPKWHVLAGRYSHQNNPEMKADDPAQWVAVCGYQRAFGEVLFHAFPNLRKTAPTKARRCRKCLNDLPAYLALRAEQARQAAATEQTPPQENENTND